MTDGTMDPDTLSSGATNAAPRPKGDSFGTLGEQVVTKHVKPRELRTLRERQGALLVLCVAILLIILDTSVVTVALPSIRADLEFSQHNLAWVVNAYLIPFGGILLFAGRLGDLVGAKRVFVWGLVLFTLASVACGMSQTQEMLIGARFVQGVGGALASAVGLGLIVTMFPRPNEQSRALAFYAFVASSGAILGLLVGALLTQGVNWHWIFFVNVPIGVGTLIAARKLLPEERDEDTPQVDVLGTILLVGSLMLLVYTIVQTAEHGWASTRTVGLAVAVAVGLLAFVGWQLKARNPLVPLEVFGGRNIIGPNLVITLMVAGPMATFFFGALYFQQVRQLTVMEVAFAFMPVAVVIAAVSLKLTPRITKRVDSKYVLVGGLAAMVAGLVWLGRLPTDSDYLLDVLPSLLLIGLGTGLGLPAALTTAIADATRSDSGVRSGLVNTTQQLGGALALAVLTAVAARRTEHELASGQAVPAALTSGYGLGFLVAAGIVVVGLVLAVVVVKEAVPRTAPTDLDPVRSGVVPHREDLTGAVDPDFLAIGLGGTNMMAMLWSVASGRRAVGVELRGDPAEAVMHWTVREDLYHHLATIDHLMMERYGEDRIPRIDDGSLFLLHKCFFNTDPDSSADARTDEVLTNYAGQAHIAGLVKAVDLIDDRWVDGTPSRTVTSFGAVPNPGEPDLSRADRPFADAFGKGVAFQVGAREMLLLFRRYLQAVERMDLAAGVEPRCRLFLYHRVVAPSRRRRWTALFRRGPGETDGFVPCPDGRRRVRIEAVREMESKGTYRRVRRPGTEVIDLGVPELFAVAEGLGGEDPARLGFRQEPVTVDHGDGRGPVPVQADYLFGLMTIYLDSRYRRRMTSEFDRNGTEYWVRQVAVGHENDAEIAWVTAEVPDFMTFDPILAGLVPPGTDPKSRKYYAGYQHLVRQYFLDQVSIMTELPPAEIRRTSIARNPELFTVTLKCGKDARVATNGVVAGDSFGNGHFLASDGFNTGVIGHAARIGRYWRDRAAGMDPEQATRKLADGIKEDTSAWVADSIPAFQQPPAGADAQRNRQRAAILDATRRHRRSIAPVNHRDEWSRLNVFVGRLYSFPVPPVQPTHPLSRAAGDWPTERAPEPAAEPLDAAPLAGSTR